MRKRKLFSVLLSGLMALSITVPGLAAEYNQDLLLSEEQITSSYDNNGNTVYTENSEPAYYVMSNSGQNSLLAAANDSALCYISASRVKDIIDGSAPFDADNASGNDESSSNGIIRSFDDIRYTLEYVTALYGNDTGDETKVMCEFTLPCTKKEAVWDTDAMQWMQDVHITTNPDGSQTITGYKTLKHK